MGAKDKKQEPPIILSPMSARAQILQMIPVKTFIQDHTSMIDDFAKLCILPDFLPQPFNIFTRIYLPYL